MKAMRAKVQVTSVVIDHYQEKVTMEPVYGGSTNAEDNTFSAATPSGKIELAISNKALHGVYRPGQKFYVDFTPIEDTPKV